MYKAHIPPETAFALTTKREEKVHKQHEMYMPNAKTQRQGPNATYIPLEMGFAFATQREEIYTKKMKCTWLTQEMGVTLRKRYQHVGILALGDAEVLFLALGDAKVPYARYFAFWWNIGFRVRRIYDIRSLTLPTPTTDTYTPPYP